MKHILSKSTFMYECQCQKRLFLHKFEPELSNPIDEQQQAIMDIEISSLEKKLSKSKMLKQGMMQELLTGRVRLV